MNPFDELEARIAALEARADTASAIRATILLTLGEMNKTIRVLLQRDIEATMPPAAEGEKPGEDPDCGPDCEACSGVELTPDNVADVLNAKWDAVNRKNIERAPDAEGVDARTCDHRWLDSATGMHRVCIFCAYYEILPGSVHDTR